jgi:four helix bundle protein
MYDHRSLEAWREARGVSLAVLEIARNHWKPWAAALVSQLQRASLSVQLNIAEGWTYNRSPTYRKHLGIAFGSAVETAELLDLAITSGFLPRPEGNAILERSQRCQKLLIGLLKKHRPMA